MKRCPCKGCTDRKQHCHGKCKLYQEWKAETDAEKQWLREYIPITSEEALKRARKKIVKRARGWERP